MNEICSILHIVIFKDPKIFAIIFANCQFLLLELDVWGKMVCEVDCD